MSYEKSISDHYLHGDLLHVIEAALPAIGKTTQNVTIEDLAPVDEFHIGGRIATDHLLEQLNLPEKGHVLDVGCGLGGAARYVASEYNCQVVGVDLTAEYITTGQTLSDWLGLGDQVKLQQGSALAMPFADQTFDAGYMLHVGMNIEDKTQLFKEIYRVLKPGATFAVYDIMRQNDEALIYPVPWASEKSTSYLATPEQYTQASQVAGLSVVDKNNRHEFALNFFKQLSANTTANPPPIGLHLLMQNSTAEKITNMVSNLVKGCIAPVELVLQKKG